MYDILEGLIDYSEIKDISYVSHMLFKIIGEKTVNLNQDKNEKKLTREYKRDELYLHRKRIKKEKECKERHVCVDKPTKEQLKALFEVHERRKAESIRKGLYNPNRKWI